MLGVTTTTGYLRGLLADDAVRAGDLDTGLIDRRGVPAGPIDDDGVAIAAAMLILADRGARAGDDPFERVGRLAARRRRGRVSHWRLSVGGGEPVEVTVPPEYVAMVSPLGDGRFAIDGRGEWLLARDGDVDLDRPRRLGVVGAPGLDRRPRRRRRRRGAARPDARPGAARPRRGRGRGERRGPAGRARVDEDGAGADRARRRRGRRAHRAPSATRWPSISPLARVEATAA